MKKVIVFIALAVFTISINAQNTPPTIQWQKSLGGSFIEKAYSIQQTNDGGYIVAGYSDSNNGDITVNHGGYDYWIVKLDSSGNPVVLCILT